MVILFNFLILHRFSATLTNTGLAGLLRVSARTNSVPGVCLTSIEVLFIAAI